MRYVISALAPNYVTVQTMLASLERAGISRDAVEVLDGDHRRVRNRHDAPILVAVTSSDLDKTEAIKQALLAGGGSSLTSAEDSSVLDAV